MDKKDSGLDIDSKLKIPQMRAVDKERLTKYIGALDKYLINEAENAITLHLTME